MKHAPKRGVTSTSRSARLSRKGALFYLTLRTRFIPPLDEATKKRLRAGSMLLAGKRPAEVAEKVGVARQTMYTWKGLLDEGGIDALRAVLPRGRPAKLDASQLEGLRGAILQSPIEHGFGTELWTLKRVGAVIWRLYGVKFGTTQLWRILGALGFAACWMQATLSQCHDLWKAQ